MDVRSIEDVAAVVEHNGTVPVWWLVRSQEMRQATDGGFLELVSEWEVAGGGLVDPHSHPTHEFYYILSGRGIMKIGSEERAVGQGDLIYTPRTRSTASGPRQGTLRFVVWPSPSVSEARVPSTTPADFSFSPR